MKRLDVTTVLLKFDGKPVTDGREEMTLRHSLLFYLNFGRQRLHNAGQVADAYDAGRVIAAAKDYADLTQEQYDVVKLLADNPPNQGQPDEIQITEQVKRLVDAAVEVKKQKAGKK